MRTAALSGRVPGATTQATAASPPASAATATKRGLFALLGRTTGDQSVAAATG
jgi:hypothetical protein